MRRAASLILVILVPALHACSSGPAAPPASQPPGPLQPVHPPGASAPPGADVTQPFPIDRGDAGAQTPGTYKGLWLRLVANNAPAVTPVSGVIGIVCIGMSNAFRECNAYVDSVRTVWAGEINPQVRAVNCAVGGHAIERWIDAAYDATLWDACINTKLAQADIRHDQVRVLWHKAANQFTAAPGGAALPLYPAAGSDYEHFLANLDAFAARVPVKFPSVQAVYSSSRSYGGFASSHTRGEPLSYEEGHALNTWLSRNATAFGVMYAWGPYLWAPECATSITNATGLCYVRSDFVNDGVHPSDAGQAKIARALHERLLQETWYRR